MSYAIPSSNLAVNDEPHMKDLAAMVSAEWQEAFTGLYLCDPHGMKRMCDTVHEWDKGSRSREQLLKWIAEFKPTWEGL